MSRTSKADHPPAGELTQLRVPGQAQATAVLCQHWPRRAQEEVLAWIQGRLAHPSARTRRAQQLWLVRDMVSGLNVNLLQEEVGEDDLALVCDLIEEGGTLPTAATFDRVAELYRDEGYTVWNREQLCRLVGGNWAEVCRRAAGLVLARASDRSKTRPYDGSAIPPKGTYWRHDPTVRRRDGEITPTERLDRIARGLIWSLDFFKYRPALEEYLHFAVNERRLAQRLKQLEPMLATKKPIMDAFEDFELAMDYATEHEDRLRGDALGIKVRLKRLEKNAG